MRSSRARHEEMRTVGLVCACCDKREGQTAQDPACCTVGCETVALSCAVSLCFWCTSTKSSQPPNAQVASAGNPIKVPKDSNPSKELCQKYLDLFIQEMKRIVAENKAAAGYPDVEFIVQ